MKKRLALLLALVMLLTACNARQPNTPAENSGDVQSSGGAPTVGVLLPDEQLSWTEQGVALTQKLQAMGYEASVVYADNDPQRQIAQMQDMINTQTDCIVVAAVDSLLLADSVDRAKDAGIPVIAYDRLLLQTQGAACYVGFDSYADGVKTGEFVVESKLLQTAGEENRSYTVEFFMDSPENPGALEFHRGVMSVLQPYFDSGVLVCPSGYVAFEDTCIQDGVAELAAKQCAYLLNRCYAEKMPDILVTASDTLVTGVCSALDGISCPAESWPLVTGQGMGEETEARLQAGKQAMTVRLDREALADTCAQQVQALLTQQFSGGDATCDNGTMSVPAFLLQGEIVPAENDRQEDETDTESG